MLSNFQTADKSLLQIFLLGQPEFRATLLGKNMKQLLQRVIATYHLGPLDAEETQAYIEHRLRTVGWRGDPSFNADVYSSIYDFTGGIPRKINTLCDRLLLMGYLEEIHAFGKEQIDAVIHDIQQEFILPPEAETEQLTESSQIKLQELDGRVQKMENSVTTILDLLKQVLLSSIRDKR